MQTTKFKKSVACRIRLGVTCDLQIQGNKYSINHVTFFLALLLGGIFFLHFRVQKLVQGTGKQETELSDSEDGNRIFLRNICKYLTDYNESYSKTLHNSQALQ
jgi:hypothetical protein